MIHKLFPQLSPVRLGISEKVGRGKRPQLTSKMPCHSLKKEENWRKHAVYSESRILMIAPICCMLDRTKPNTRETFAEIIIS